MYAQENLVKNEGFETHASCPEGDSALDLLDDWFSPNEFLPDYYNTCSSSPFYAVPINEYGNQEAANGDAYIGLHTFFANSSLANKREYLSAQLSTPMIAGSLYCVGFKVNLADESQFAIDELGMLLSSTNPSSLNLFQEIPQIVASNVQDLQNTDDWITISFDYIAEGGESFLTIGNFNDDATTDADFIKPSGFAGSAYYYIDDVLIYESIAQGTPIHMGENDTICETFLELTPGEGFARYEWQDGSTKSSFIAQRTGTYSVIVEDACGNVSQTDRFLAFKNCSEICLRFPNSFSPNGDGHNETFKGLGCFVENYTLIIYNRWGEQIYLTQNQQDSWDGRFNGKNQPTGSYLWSVSFTDLNGKLQKFGGFINLLR